MNGAKPADTRESEQRPFSYLFTALTFKPILDFVGLVPQQSPRPVDQKHLAKLRQLSAYLYGRHDPPREPAISESRQIKDLAQALASEVGRRRLAQGDSVDEALEAVPAESARFERLLSHASGDLLKAMELAPRQRKDPIARDQTSRTLEIAYDLAGRMGVSMNPR